MSAKACMTVYTEGQRPPEKTFSGGQFSGHDVPLAFPGDDFLLQKEENSVLEYQYQIVFSLLVLLS